MITIRAIVVVLCLWPASLTAQNIGSAADVHVGAVLPATCVTGQIYFLISGTQLGLYGCTTANTWVSASVNTVAPGVPSGTILAVQSGVCPTGFAEATALNGRTLIGTLVANGNVGTTGGADTVTPAGAITASTLAWPASVPTFTGAALATHAHELPWQIASTTTFRQIAGATFGTGASRAATAVSPTLTANTTSAAVALSQAVSAGTPTGLVAWPASAPTASAPAFTGAASDNRSAFTRVIFCQKT